MDTSLILRRSLRWVVALYVVNFFFLGWLIGGFDYDHLSAYYELAWRFWQTSPSLPQFNPYLCGGRTLGGDPQIPIFHPLVFFIGLLGPAWILKIEMLCQIALGAVGLWGVLGRLGAEREGRLWGMLLFLAGGGVVARFMVGHVTLGFYFLLPLFFLFSYQISDRSPSIKSLFWYFLLFGYAGLYKPNFLIYLLPPLAVEHFFRTIWERKPRLFFYFCVGIGMCALVNAVVYLPAFRYFSDFPRPDDLPFKPIPLYTALANFLLPLKAIPKLLYGPVFLQRHEYNYFLGPVALWFALLGMRQKTERRAERAGLLLFLMLSLWLGLGSPGPGLQLDRPFTWFAAFWPGFQSIRVPPRFWFGAFFALVVFSSLGFRRPQGRWQAMALVVVGLLPLLGNATLNLCRASWAPVKTQWVASRTYPRDILFVQGDPNDTYRHIRQGVGVIQCLYNLEVFPSPQLTEGRALKMEGAEHQVLTAEWRGWDQIELLASGPSTSLILNLNHSPYWQYVGTGARIVSQPGDRLTLKTEGKPVHGMLKYEQPLVEFGALLSLISLGALGLLAGLGFSRTPKKG
jgi:hypothetical protein